jgi:hypothetical protein
MQQVPPEAARSESRRVDFKESLDVASPGEWVDCGPLLKFDPANIVDKIAVYTGQQLVATRQYSEAFCDWMIDQYTKDNGFFQAAREKAYEETRKKGKR